jgi:hypothetical protein
VYLAFGTVTQIHTIEQQNFEVLTGSKQFLALKDNRGDAGHPNISNRRPHCPTTELQKAEELPALAKPEALPCR